jgi:SAM-dependent methyltransferase
MTPDALADLWTGYEAAPVSRDVHPSDRMSSHHGHDWAKYELVGASAIRVVFAALSLTPTREVRRLLDFGSGYGRVSRHFQTFLPDAERFVADIDEEASGFCAERFRGIAVPSSRDFGRLDLPGDLDLIWVGSVFTHVTFDRMEQLFRSLAGRLAPGGTLVATFHGEFVIGVQKVRPIIHPPFWDRILAEYEADGVGHHPYGGANGTDNWGVSLITPAKVATLSRSTGLEQAAHLHRGWAGFQDVGVWARPR